jgi:hypothetical protein
MAPFLADAARRHVSALDALGGAAASDDLILTTPKGSLLLHLFGDAPERRHLIALAVGRLANPGMARLVLSSYEARLLELLR